MNNIQKYIFLKKFYLAVFILLILLYLNCYIEVIDKYCSINNNQTNVYIVGEQSRQARMWLNCSSKDLTKGRNGKLNAIVINGSDIYFAGYEDSVAKVWKNEKSTYLKTDNNYYSEASAIFINGNDVYVTGYEGTEAKLWKNGMDIKLEGVIQGYGLQSYSRALFVKDTNIFVVGNIENKATLWKNGKLLNLTNGLINTYATSILVKDTSVYIAINDSKNAKIWINGVTTLLETELQNDSNYIGESSYVNSLFIKGNDLYAVGYIYFGKPSKNVATIWKNGKGALLSNFDRSSVANSIYVIDDDVYVVGYKNYYGVAFAIGGSLNAATVWKNGKEIALFDAFSNAKSIFVTNK